MVTANHTLLRDSVCLQEEALTEAHSILCKQTSDSVRLIELVDGTVGLAEMEIMLQSDAAVDCEAGCAWCCYQRVTTSPAEVLRIAHYLRQTLDASALAQLVARITSLDRQTRGLDRGERLALHQPCPLLTAEAVCLVYHVRPLPCRGYTSTDADFCRAVLCGEAPSSAVDADPVRYLFCQGALTGLNAALVAQDLEGGTVELVSALTIVLTEPDAAERWWGGEAVFAAAQVTTEGIAAAQVTTEGIA